MDGRAPRRERAVRGRRRQADLVAEVRSRPLARTGGHIGNAGADDAARASQGVVLAVGESAVLDVRVDACARAVRAVTRLKGQPAAPRLGDQIDAQHAQGVVGDRRPGHVVPAGRAVQVALVLASRGEIVRARPKRSRPPPSRETQVGKPGQVAPEVLLKQLINLGLARRPPLKWWNRLYTFGPNRIGRSRPARHRSGERRCRGRHRYQCPRPRRVDRAAHVDGAARDRPGQRRRRCKTARDVGLRRLDDVL